MSPVKFMQEARDLDAAIQALDRRYMWARANHAPDQSLDRLLAARNILVRQQGSRWGTQQVPIL